jgi:transcriptional regulator with GAF, ATPase, and Fis domain
MAESGKTTGAPMKPEASDNNSAFSAMAMDILNNLLSRVDNPADLGRYLTQKIQAITGADCVVIIQCLSTPGVMAHRVVSVEPTSRHAWAESSAANEVYEVVHCLPAAQCWRQDELSDGGERLRQEGFDISMSFPLNAGEFRVGAILILGLPDEKHLASVHSLLNTLSTVVALVLRNAFLIEHQEQTIHERTEALQFELSERNKAEALLNGQRQVLELVATGSPLSESLTTLVRFIEAHSPCMFGSILLLDKDGVHLRHGAAPSLPAEYTAAIDGVAIGPSVGSCGTAAYCKDAVYVEDIATDPRWADYKAVALPHGLHACWSTPIFDAQRQVLGTFAMYKK